MRENAEQKGRRYLTEARLTVERVTGDVVRARCRGGGDFYEVGWHDGDWYCTCPALTRCSHLIALQLVVGRPRIESEAA